MTFKALDPYPNQKEKGDLQFSTLNKRKTKAIANGPLPLEGSA